MHVWRTKWFVISMKRTNLKPMIWTEASLEKQYVVNFGIVYIFIFAYTPAIICASQSNIQLYYIVFYVRGVYSEKYTGSLFDKSDTGSNNLSTHRHFILNTYTLHNRLSDL